MAEVKNIFLNSIWRRQKKTSFGIFITWHILSIEKKKYYIIIYLRWPTHVHKEHLNSLYAKVWIKSIDDVDGKKKKKKDETNFVINQHTEQERKREKKATSHLFALSRSYTRSISKKEETEAKKERYYVSICVHTIARYTSVFVWERTQKEVDAIFHFVISVTFIYYLSFFRKP
jgi:hypothetical protein